MKTGFDITIEALTSDKTMFSIRYVERTDIFQATLSIPKYFDTFVEFAEVIGGLEPAITRESATEVFIDYSIPFGKATKHIQFRLTLLEKTMEEKVSSLVQENYELRQSLNAIQEDQKRKDELLERFQQELVHNQRQFECFQASLDRFREKTRELLVFKRRFEYKQDMFMGLNGQPISQQVMEFLQRIQNDISPIPDASQCHQSKGHDISAIYGRCQGNISSMINYYTQFPYLSDRFGRWESMLLILCTMRQFEQVKTVARYPPLSMLENSQFVPETYFRTLLDNAGMISCEYQKYYDLLLGSFIKMRDME